MPRELVISDVHEDIDRLNRILSLAGKVDHTYFLGDWLDTFKAARYDEVATFLEANIGASDKTFLWGNHDMPYAYPSIRELRCSGFDPIKLPIIAKAMDMARKYFQFTVATQGWQLSHAGISPKYWQGLDNLINKTRIALAEGRITSLVGAGWARGGDQIVGGCTWQDWNEEFLPIDGVKQIVGHTKGKEPRWKGDNLCLDTGLRHYAIIEDGQVQVMETYNNS